MSLSTIVYRFDDVDEPWRGLYDRGWGRPGVVASGPSMQRMDQVTDCFLPDGSGFVKCAASGCSYRFDCYPDYPV